ncbi:MAG: alpha/beta hydrolase [Pseudomonadota bacterium]
MPTNVLHTPLPVAKARTFGGTAGPLPAVRVGSGAPPLLLVHGVGATHRDWFTAGFADSLSERHALVAVDRPGYGASPPRGAERWSVARQAEALAATISTEGLKAPVVVAHSFGALPVLAMVLQGTPVSALVLIAGVYYPKGIWARTAGALLAGKGRFRRAVRGAALPLARSSLGLMIAQMFAPDPPTDAFNTHFETDLASRKSQLEASLEDAAMICRESAALAPRYGALRLPILLIAGSGDRVVPTHSQTVAFSRAVPQAQCHVLKGEGHMVHHTARQKVVGLTEAFLGKEVPS